MKIKKSHIAAAALGCIAMVPATASALDVTDYTDIKKTSPAAVKEMRPLSDGVSYTCLSDDGKAIDVYSYKTGKKISTLFSIDGIKGDLKISEFEGYQLSSNEKKILLWNKSEQIYRYSFYAEYYVYDILRSTLSRVSDQGPQRGAVVSHDGRMVAYMRGNNVYISNLDYKTDKAVTTDGEKNKIIYGTPDWSYEEEFGVLNTLRWSGDDNVLAFMRFDESEVPTYSFDDYKSYCNAEPLSDPYPEAYTYKYPLAGYPNSKVSVLAYDLNTRVTKTMDLPIGGGYVPSLEFDGNGKNLMVMVLNRDQNHLQLFQTNPGSTLSKLLLTEKSEAWLSPVAYQMVKYGPRSFVIGSERSGYRHLYEYDYSGNMLRQITKGDFNITAYYGKDARGNHYVQTTSLGAINRNVARVSAKGELTLLNPKEGFESASFSTTMDYFVREYSSATVPPQYSICTSTGKHVADLELNREYAAKYAHAPVKEFLKVKNDAGEEMDACIIKPLGFDSAKQYPLMMYQYNGPDSQEVLNKWKITGEYFIAASGYVVAMVDGRGTGNRSRQWANCVYRKLGQYEVADQLAGARYFCSLPYVDGDRASCFGWSYGGYMTLMELTAPDCPFVAGVSMAPVTDWRYYDSIYTERYMSTPQQNEDGYNRASALERTSGLNAKLLIMSGTSDDNVHFYNTLKYTSKLNYEGKLFDMMAFTGFEHSLRMCNARTMLYRKLVQFLDANVKNIK